MCSVPAIAFSSTERAMLHRFRGRVTRRICARAGDRAAAQLFDGARAEHNVAGNRVPHRNPKYGVSENAA